MVSPKQSNWLNQNADNFLARMVIQTASVEEFPSDKINFNVATPRPQKKVKED